MWKNWLLVAVAAFHFRRSCSKLGKLNEFDMQLLINKKSIGICLLAVLMNACRSVPCHNQNLTPVFIGFSVSDIDTLIFREYQKSENFQHLLDTFVITTTTRNAHYVSSHDSTIVLLDVIGGEKKKILIPDYDWQVSIPSIQRTDLIQEMVSPQSDNDCWKCTCWNPINSFKQNGKQIIPTQGDQNVFGYSYPAYIRK